MRRRLLITALTASFACGAPRLLAATAASADQSSDASSSVSVSPTPSQSSTSHAKKAKVQTAEDKVNFDDPNLRVSHEYVADAVSICLQERGNDSTLKKCLISQGITETDDLSNAIDQIRATMH